MRPPPRLSNCYIPLQVPVSQSNNGSNELKWENESMIRRKINILSGRKIYKSMSDSKQTNQRNTHELRRVRIESNVIRSSSSSTGTPISGSSIVELGQTKVLCTVIGPVTANCSAVPSTTTLSIDTGTIHVRVSYLPTTSSFPIQHIPIVTNSFDLTIPTSNVASSSSSSQQQQKAHTPTATSRLTPKLYSNFIQQRERELSKRITTAISAAIPLHQYPKNIILIQLTIFYDDDGCIIPTCLTAITIALMDASIEMYDTITSCSVAIVSIPKTPLDDTNAADTILASANVEMQSIVIADPTMNEMSIADSIVTIAMLPNWDEITLWEQKLSLTSTAISDSSTTITNQAIQWCQDGCRTMHQFIREHLVQQQQKQNISKQLDDTHTDMELDHDDDDKNATTKKRKIALP